MAETTPKAPRRPSVEEHKAALLKKLSDWIDGGKTPEEAVEMLTEKQYDFLIDHDVDLDALLLTPEQLKNVTEGKKKIERNVKPGGYNKKYPQAKQDLFNGLVAYLTEQGAEIRPKDKENYRDLDFDLNGTHYKIVLSNPRT